MKNPLSLINNREQLMMRNNTKKNSTFFHYNISILLILILFLLSFNLIATANIYAIKDKKGNVIRVTNQYQILKTEKDAGYTISVLIESPEKAKILPVKSKFKYNFKEKIDWARVRTIAQNIEQKLEIELNTNWAILFTTYWQLLIRLTRYVVRPMLMVLLLQDTLPAMEVLQLIQTTGCLVMVMSYMLKGTV